MTQVKNRDPQQADFAGQQRQKVLKEAKDASLLISKAAEEAIQVLASSADKAVGVLIGTASTIAENLNRKGTDHDLLIELRTRMESIKDDICGLRSGLSDQIIDHEKRLFSLEKSKSSTTVLLTIGTGLLTVLLSIMILHILK